MSIFWNTGLLSTQWFKRRNVNILKHWVGINPVIWAQKCQFFETLGWFQPSDLGAKKFFFETLGWYQPSDLSPKMLIFWNTGLVSTQWFKRRNVNILKHWVGINPVIWAQKCQFFETLGWFQPSDLGAKKFFFETLGWYQPSDLSPKMLIFCNTGLVSTHWFKPKKKQFFERLGWYQPSDLSAKIIFLKHWVGINPVI